MQISQIDRLVENAIGWYLRSLCYRDVTTTDEELIAGSSNQFGLSAPQQAELRLKIYQMQMSSMYAQINQEERDYGF